jgi:hypothetical protein
MPEKYIYYYLKMVCRSPRDHQVSEHWIIGVFTVLFTHRRNQWVEPVSGTGEWNQRSRVGEDFSVQGFASGVKWDNYMGDSGELVGMRPSDEGKLQ